MASFESVIQNKQTIEWQKINPSELPSTFATDVDGEIADGLQVYKWNKREISKQVTEYKITGTMLRPEGLFDVVMSAQTFDKKYFIYKQQKIFAKKNKTARVLISYGYDTAKLLIYAAR